MKDTILNVDLSQAELRCMAVFSGDKWMINALQRGQGDFFDTHMMPVCFPWIHDKFGTVAEYKEKEPVAHKEDRTKVKAVQYGLAFGREARAIGKELQLTQAQAQQIIDNYLSTAVEFATWRETIKTAAISPADRDILVNPFGRRYQAEIITAKNMRKVQREALSFLPQSTSSDICLATAMRINEDIKGAGYKIINIVHDAIMLQGPETDARAVGQHIVDELGFTGRQVMGDTVPFLAEYSSGLSWADLD